MKKLILIFVLCGSFLYPQTSKWTQTFTSSTTGAAITTGTFEVVPYANTYPTGALSMSHLGNGVWTVTAATGTYKLYFNGSLVSKYSSFWIGEEVLSRIAAKFSSDQLTTGGIQNGAVTSDKLAADAVTAGKISSSAVTTSKIADNAVTSSKIPTGAITSDKITGSAVIEAKIQDKAVSKAKLSQAVQDLLDAGGSGTITNNPDDATLETKSGSTLGIKDEVLYMVTSTTGISAAVTAIGAESRTLYLPANSYESFPDSTGPNIEIEFQNGAYLNPANLDTIKIKGSIAAGSYQIFGDSVFVDLSESTGEIKAAWFPNLTNAYLSAGTGEKDLIINDIKTISSNTTIPNNVRVRFEDFGMISGNSTDTLTIRGFMYKEPIKLRFNGITVRGGAADSYGGNYTNVVYPQYWGGKSDNTTDNTTYIQAALDFYENRYGSVELTQGVWKTQTLEMVNGVSLYGSSTSSSGTVLKLIDSTNADVIRFRGNASGDVQYINLSHFQIDGNKAANAKGSGISTFDADSLKVYLGQNIVITDLIIKNCAENGIWIRGKGIPATIYYNWFIDNGGYGIYLNPDFSPSQIIALEAISGDGNTNGVIGVYNDYTNWEGNTYMFSNIKAEKREERQDNVIVIERGQKCDFIIDGVNAWDRISSPAATTPTNSVICINGLGSYYPQSISFRGISLNNDTTAILVDSARGVTIPSGYPQGYYSGQYGTWITQDTLARTYYSETANNIERTVVLAGEDARTGLALYNKRTADGWAGIEFYRNRNSSTHSGAGAIWVVNDTTTDQTNLYIQANTDMIMGSSLTGDYQRLTLSTTNGFIFEGTRIELEDGSFDIGQKPDGTNFRRMIGVQPGDGSTTMDILIGQSSTTVDDIILQNDATTLTVTNDPGGNVSIVGSLAITGDLKVSGNDIDCGDGGGFSGLKFNPSTTQLEVWIDGAKIGHYATDGSYTDDVP